MTTTPLEPAVATLWVPVIPAEMAIRGAVAKDLWRRWYTAVGTFGRAAGMRSLTVPHRVVATVRIARDGRNGITDASLERWTRAVSDALDKIGLLTWDLQRSIEVRYEAIDGIDLEQQPRHTGTELAFYLED